MLTRLAVNAASCCAWGAPDGVVRVARVGSGGTVLCWSNPPRTRTQSLGSGAADGYHRAYFWSEGSAACVLCCTRGSQLSKKASTSDILPGFWAKNLRPNGSSRQLARVHGSVRRIHCSDSG